MPPKQAKVSKQRASRCSSKGRAERRAKRGKSRAKSKSSAMSKSKSTALSKSGSKAQPSKSRAKQGKSRRGSSASKASKASGSSRQSRRSRRGKAGKGKGQAPKQQGNKLLPVPRHQSAAAKHPAPVKTKSVASVASAASQQPSTTSLSVSKQPKSSQSSGRTHRPLTKAEAVADLQIANVGQHIVAYKLKSNQRRFLTITPRALGHVEPGKTVLLRLSMAPGMPISPNTRVLLQGVYVEQPPTNHAAVLNNTKPGRLMEVKLKMHFENIDTAKPGERLFVTLYPENERPAHLNKAAASGSTASIPAPASNATAPAKQPKAKAPAKAARGGPPKGVSIRSSTRTIYRFGTAEEIKKGQANKAAEQAPSKTVLRVKATPASVKTPAPAKSPASVKTPAPVKTAQPCAGKPPVGKQAAQPSSYVVQCLCASYEYVSSFFVRPTTAPSTSSRAASQSPSQNRLQSSPSRDSVPGRVQAVA